MHGNSYWIQGLIVLSDGPGCYLLPEIRKKPGRIKPVYSDQCAAVDTEDIFSFRLHSASG